MAHAWSGPSALHVKTKSHESRTKGRPPRRFRILSHGGLRVRVSRGFAVTGYRLRERLAAPVAEIRDVQTISSGAHR
jgi:hypothetical protein